MNELADKILLFNSLAGASAGPVNAEKIAKDVIKTLELFEDRHDAQSSNTENKE